MAIRAKFVGTEALIEQETRGSSGLPYKIMAAGRQHLYQTAQQKLLSMTTTHTGTLLRSHRADPLVVSGTTMSTAVEATAPYARYVHDGTRAHVIRPVRAKALSFIMPGVGRVFAQKVNHPGGKPHPWMTEAAEDLEAGFTGGIPTWY